MGTKYAGEFQNLGAGGRSCGMGGTGFAQNPDASVIYFNPAGTVLIKPALILMHAENFSGEVRSEFGSAVFSRDNAAYGLGLQLVTAGGIILTTLEDTTAPPGSTNPPIPYDTVSTAQAVLYLNSARSRGIFSYGANLKLFYENLSAITGFGAGLDLGVRVNLNSLQIGLTVRDLGLAPIVWDNQTTETILPKVILACAPVLATDDRGSAVTMEVACAKQIDVEGFEQYLGLEYLHRGLLAARIGRSNGAYTLGMGLRYRQFALDYALILNTELATTTKLSAGMSF